MKASGVGETPKDFKRARMWGIGVGAVATVLLFGSGVAAAGVSKKAKGTDAVGTANRIAGINIVSGIVAGVATGALIASYFL